MNESDRTPRVVSRAEWQAAHDRLLAKEKAATHARDALAAERRRLPWLRIEKTYVFDGPQDRARLRDLFDGRRQLILYSFMFAPDVDGWPEAGCPGCSFFVDNLGDPAHLQARDVSLVLVSRAPIENIEGYRIPKAYGVDVAVVLFCQQRFQYRYRGHDGQGRGSSRERLPA